MMCQVLEGTMQKSLRGIKFGNLFQKGNGDCQKLQPKLDGLP